jgi:FAD/FMN-containing dehydrogenase
MFHTITAVSALVATVLAVTSPRSGQITDSNQSLQACLASKNVPTSLNSSSDWTSLTNPYNLRLKYTPTAVTLPTTRQHVSNSVLCAAEAGVKVQARSGGHSYGSFSLGGKNGSLVVDLQSFNTVSLDKCESHLHYFCAFRYRTADNFPATGIVAVGGGARLGNLGLGIYNQGQRALPHGTYPGVGIGGHYTHGGFGYSSRRWGMSVGFQQFPLQSLALSTLHANSNVLIPCDNLVNC